MWPTRQRSPVWKEYKDKHRTSPWKTIHGPILTGIGDQPDSSGCLLPFSPLAIWRQTGHGSERRALLRYHRRCLKMQDRPLLHCQYYHPPCNQSGAVWSIGDVHAFSELYIWAANPQGHRTLAVKTWLSWTGWSQAGWVLCAAARLLETASLPWSVQHVESKKALHFHHIQDNFKKKGKTEKYFSFKIQKDFMTFFGHLVTQPLPLPKLHINRCKNYLCSSSPQQNSLWGWWWRPDPSM